MPDLLPRVMPRRFLDLLPISACITIACINALFMELARGIEPPTCGLQNRCSAIELRQPE